MLIIGVLEGRRCYVLLSRNLFAYLLLLLLGLARKFIVSRFIIFMVKFIVEVIIWDVFLYPGSC